MSTPKGKTTKCEGVLRNGGPCKNNALPGQTVCGVHKRSRRTNFKKALDKHAYQVKRVGTAVSAATTFYHAVHFLVVHWPGVLSVFNAIAHVHGSSGLGDGPGDDSPTSSYLLYEYLNPEYVNYPEYTGHYDVRAMRHMAVLELLKRAESLPHEALSGSDWLQTKEFKDALSHLIEAGKEYEKAG